MSRSVEELEELQRQAAAAALEAQLTKTEAQKNEPIVLALVKALKERRVQNHFGEDYAVTMRTRSA